MVTMLVVRSGYWDGDYPQPGDTIEVAPAYVATLEQAQFARRLDPGPPASGRPPKEGTYGTRKNR